MIFPFKGMSDDEDIAEYVANELGGKVCDISNEVPSANGAAGLVNQENGSPITSDSAPPILTSSTNQTISPNFAPGVITPSILTDSLKSPSAIDSMEKLEHPKLKELKLRTKAIRDVLAAAQGLPIPEAAIKLLSRAAVAYSDACELSGSQKAQRDELGATYALQESAGKSELMAKGSEFGRCHTEAEGIANGMLEILNSLKKIQEYYSQTIKNHY